MIVFKKKVKWAFHLIGPLIFVLVLSKLELRKIFELLMTVNIKYLVLAILCQIISNLFKVKRWDVLLSFYKRYSFYRVLEASLYGSVFAAITPGRIGEAAKIKVIKDPCLGYPKIISTVIIDRMFDVITVILAGYIGAVFLRKVINISGFFLGMCPLVGVICIVLSIFLVKRVSCSIGPENMDKKDCKSENWLYRKVARVLSYIKTDESLSHEKLQKIFLASIIINIVSYFFYFLTIYYVALSLNIKISYLFVIFSYSLVFFLGLLPISISGIGTRDVTLIYCFGLLGILHEKAIALSFIDLSIMTYGVSLLMFMVVVLSKLFRPT